MHYICIITVIYIMYTNVSMLMYVIEPKIPGKGEKSCVYLKDIEGGARHAILYILTHRDDLVVASANKSSTRAIRIFYIYNRSNLCGHIRFLNVLQYSVIQTRVPEKERGENWLKTDKHLVFRLRLGFIIIEKYASEWLSTLSRTRVHREPLLIERCSQHISSQACSNSESI